MIAFVSQKRRHLIFFFTDKFIFNDVFIINGEAKLVIFWLQYDIQGVIPFWIFTRIFMRLCFVLCGSRDVLNDAVRIHFAEGLSVSH